MKSLKEIIRQGLQRNFGEQVRSSDLRLLEQTSDEFSSNDCTRCGENVECWTMDFDVLVWVRQRSSWLDVCVSRTQIKDSGFSREGYEFLSCEYTTREEWDAEHPDTENLDGWFR